MKNYQRKIVLLLIGLCIFFTQLASAAAVNQVKGVRTSQTAEKVRIVFDLAAPVEYTSSLSEKPLQVKLEMKDTQNKSGQSELSVNDPFVGKVSLTENQGKLTAIVDLKMASKYQIFALKNPNRLVIDIIKSFDQKVPEEVATGLKYTYWLRSTAAGPVAAYILDINPKMGYALKPALSNDAIEDLEPLSGIAARNQALAAVNASYFGPTGEIIGLLKMDGQIASVPMLPRTAFGIFPDGRMLIDQAEYQDTVEVRGNTYYLSGVNCERGTDGLVLYNKYFGESTGTNEFGCEYVIRSGKVSAINPADSKIPDDGFILSVHGKMAQAFASLSVGDKVNVEQRLNKIWDKASYVIGAGPRLVKNGQVFVNSKEEQVAPDIAIGRAPRTALGLTKDGHVLLVVVDGRQATSVGFTLSELAAFMKEIGAVDAMNFDGGGSSEMMVKGEVKNNPSDGHERNIGDALIVVGNSLAN